MVSPLVLKMLTCILSATATNSNHPKDVEAAYACILAHNNQISSMSSEEDFEALQKELTVMLSERCQREADRYADRHCDYNKRSERYDECRGREYERCEDSYEGHTSALLLDRFLDWVDDRFFTRDQLH